MSKSSSGVMPVARFETGAVRPSNQSILEPQPATAGVRCPRGRCCLTAQRASRYTSPGSCSPAGPALPDGHCAGPRRHVLGRCRLVRHREDDRELFQTFEERNPEEIGVGSQLVDRDPAMEFVDDEPYLEARDVTPGNDAHQHRR